MSPPSADTRPLDLEAIKARLSVRSGETIWYREDVPRLVEEVERLNLLMETMRPMTPGEAVEAALAPQPKGAQS